MSYLKWPHWKPRRDHFDRVYGRFGKRNSNGYGVVSVTIAEGTNRVLDQLDKFTKPGKFHRVPKDTIVISTNLRTRTDGLPYSNQRAPEDPGAAVWFELDGKTRVLPCDRYLTVADNLAAIAASLESLRTLERHDSNLFDTAMSGFEELPAPGQTSKKPWWVVLDVEEEDEFETIKFHYDRLRSFVHPDKGGTDAEFDEVQKAWEEAKRIKS